MGTISEEMTLPNKQNKRNFWTMFVWFKESINDEDVSSSAFEDFLMLLPSSDLFFTSDGWCCFVILLRSLMLLGSSNYFHCFLSQCLSYCYYNVWSSTHNFEYFFRSLKDEGVISSQDEHSCCHPRTYFCCWWRLLCHRM